MTGPDTLVLLKLLSGTAWLANLVLLIGPLWRLARRRGRYLDPFWSVVLLGVLNRLMFVSGQVPAAISYIAAILLASLLFLVMWSYQRADH